MVKSFAGWRFYDDRWTRREVWSTWTEFDTLAEANTAKGEFHKGGVGAVVLEGETEYNRFCYSHIIA